MNFDEELNYTSKEKKEYTKTFRNELDVFISTLKNKGVMFYGFTINFLEIKLVKPEEMGAYKDRRINKFNSTRCRINRVYVFINRKTFFD